MGGKMLVYGKRTEMAGMMLMLCGQEGIAVLTADSEQELYTLLEEDGLHMLLLDMELDGNWNKEIRLIRDIRGKSRVPLIVVSAQTAEAAKIMALEAGADDYVTAECSPLELLARVKSHIRRYVKMAEGSDAGNGICRVSGLLLDDAQKAAFVEGRNAGLTPIEYRILRFLARQRGKVFTPDQIYENVWKERAVCDAGTVMVHICHIRKKIENDPREPRYLKAVWGYGYKVG